MLRIKNEYVGYSVRKNICQENKCRRLKPERDSMWADKLSGVDIG